MADSEPGREVARSELRASHEDRDRVVELLRVSAGDGRLTADELDERLELAMTARTYGELAKLVADLPAEGSVTGAPAVRAPRAKEVVRIDTGSGHAVRNGRWILPQRIEARVRSGHLKLDFTQAVISQPSLQLAAEVRSGHVILITRPGIVVDTDDVVVRSGHIRVRTPWGPDAPEVLRIEVSGKIGSGHFVARPQYRTFWQWLTRQPRPYEIAAR
ncbi:MAG: DUF1707 SHOCT-like domain-containing protein [Streptosporangiaceae bacterium]